MAWVFVIAAVGLAAHVTVVDVRERIVLTCDVLLIACFRLVLVFASWTGVVSAAEWGVEACVAACAGAFFVPLTLGILSAVLSRGKSTPAIGLGDLLLYGACLLFVSPRYLFIYLTSSAILGVLAAALCVVRGQDTFAFAPAVVVPWAVFVCLQVMSFG